MIHFIPLGSAAFLPPSDASHFPIIVEGQFFKVSSSFLPLLLLTPCFLLPAAAAEQTLLGKYGIILSSSPSPSSPRKKAPNQQQRQPVSGQKCAEGPAGGHSRAPILRRPNGETSTT